MDAPGQAPSGSGSSDSDQPITLRDPADVGRRIAHRRQQLGLTKAELAAASGMSEAYIDRLESSASALTTGQADRLAEGLRMSRHALVGADPAATDRGGAAPAAQVELEVLGIDECRRLAATEGIGRVVFTSREGRPLALPVNFAMRGQWVVFRTRPGSELASLEDGRIVSFEIDHVDETTTSGWSVIFSGPLEHADHGIWTEVAAGKVATWAGDDRTELRRLRAVEVSGRRLRNELTARQR